VTAWHDEPEVDEEALATLLMPAYRDRFALRVASQEGVFKLASGQRARVFSGDPLSRAPVLIALVVEETEEGAWIRLATPVPSDVWRQAQQDYAAERLTVQWDERNHSFAAYRERFLGEIVFQSVPVPLPPITDLVEPLKDAVRRHGLTALPWTEDAQILRLRIARLREWRPEDGWPDMSEAALLATVDLWLEAALYRLAPRAPMSALDIAYGLREAVLTASQRHSIDQLAPTALPLRSGRLRPLRYLEAGPPVLAAPIQDFLGLTEIPRIAGGRITPVVELLSPARRPLQVTSDLARFWQTVYPEIRRSLSARYPRHDWPLDPLVPPPPRPRRTR
jgi:ATP-dependent helicase HrpB